MDVRSEIEALRAEILEHNHRYYDLDAPRISDFEYDALYRRLEELEAANPAYASSESPVRRVGGAVSGSFPGAARSTPGESERPCFPSKS